MSLLSQDLMVLTAPPATGKTFWIRTYSELLQDQSILVLSPLRALADECREKWGSSVSVMTPEEWLGKKVFADVVIFDEFHLWFYWGDSFRPLMWEVFFELSQSTKLTVLLTATMASHMREEILQFSSQFDSIFWTDHGNQVLKNKPSRYVKVPTKKWMMRQILSEEQGKDVKLIFCRYRKEVFELENLLTKAGYNCLSCVGGESKYMKDRLRMNSTPDYIVATTVLSHGVNLPEIKKIFFLYEIKNTDFWIQMVARGGRRGENYEVFSLEAPEDLDWDRWQNFIQVIWLSLKQKVNHAFNDFIKF